MKRIYEKAEKDDGLRVLVDRLWPRGVSKESAKITLWMKGVTPSTELRSWFHKDAADRFSEFEKRYTKELSGSKDIIELRKIIKKQPRATLVTAVKDIEHSHVPALIKKLGISINYNKLTKATKK